MNGIIYTIAGDREIPKLFMSIKSLRAISKIPFVVYASLSNNGYKQLDYNKIQYVVEDDVPNNLKDASRFLKTNIHKITPFERTIYFDNDVVCVQNPKWIFNEIPTSGIIFGHDAGKTVSDFSKYATPGNDLNKEIFKNFNIKVDPKWHIWNGGVFLFDDRAYDFIESWHQKQLKIANLSSWAKRDQGTLIATVWEYELQNQQCLPKTANFLHGLHSGLTKDNAGRWIHRSGDLITNIHLCLSWGKKSSDTWNQLNEQINDNDNKSVYQAVKTKMTGESDKIIAPIKGKWHKPFKLIIDAIRSHPLIDTEDKYGYCCDLVNTELLGRKRKDAAIFIVDKHVVMIDYQDYVNTNKGSLKEITNRGVFPDLILKCQYRPNHENYDKYLCTILPFTYVTVDTHSGNEYLDKYRDIYSELAKNNNFKYDLFGRLAEHKPRNKLFKAVENIKNCDVKKIGMNNGDHQVASNDGRLGRTKYFNNLVRARYCIDGPGNGNLTHRLIEAWAMSQPVVCPQLKNQFYHPIKPYVHYIPIEHDYSDLKDKIEYYNNHFNKAIEIGNNGRLYYESYCSKEGISHLFYDILNKQCLI